MSGRRRTLVATWLPLLLLAGFLGGCAAWKTSPGPVPAAPSPPRPADVTADDPACAYFHFLWGKHAELHLRFDEAREAYEKALICDAAAVHVQQNLGMLLLRMRQVAEGLALLEKYLVQRPDDGRIRIVVARLLIEQQRQQEALGHLRQLSQQEPDDPRIMLMIASILAMDQRWDEAEEILAPVIRQSDRPEAYVLLARMQRQQHRYDEALAAYERALFGGRNPDILLELASLHQDYQQHDRALLLYEELLQVDSANERALLGLVQTCLASDRGERALAEANRFRSALAPGRDFDLALARLYMQGQQLEPARMLLENLLAGGDLAEARFLLAIILAEQREFAAALMQLDHVPAAAAVAPRATLLRGRIHIARGANGEAIAALRELVGLSGMGTDVHILLANLLQREGREDEARQVLQQLLEERPDEHDLRYEYGMLLDRQGLHGEAMAVMQELIRREPEHAGALNFIGYSWADANIYLELALEYIQRALAIDPDNGYIRDSLGWVYFRLGRLQQARRELERAREILGDDPHVLDHLADVLRRLGQRQQAGRIYRQVLELLEDAGEQQRVREKLQALEQKR